MNEFIPWILANPLFCIGSIISLVAAIGFLIFLRGFLLGLHQILYIDGHDEHIEHARLRVSWGLVLMINMFVLWVFVRGFATVLGFDNADLGATGSILAFYAALVAFLYFTGFAFVPPKK